MIPQVMASLKELSFPMEISDARAISMAAKCRVHRWENASYGGLIVVQRHAALVKCIANGAGLDRRLA